MSRAAALALAFGLLLPAPARAQAFRRITTAPLDWYFRLLPYPTYDPDEGLTGNLRVAWIKPSNREPPPVSKAMVINARAATSGTRGVVAMYDAPGWYRDWRFLGYVGVERLRRVPYYGQGNNSSVSDTLPTSFYRYSLIRTTAGGVVQRRIAGQLRLHLGGQWRYYRAASLGDTTAYGADVTAGRVTDTLGVHNVEARAGLIWDTRDEEASPSSGVVFEAMAARGLSDARYNRWLFSAREFIPLGEFEQWVIGLRQTAEIASGQVPVFVSYERLTTWYPEDGFGGPTSIRLYTTGRWLAQNRSVFSVDVRKKLLDFPLRTSPFRAWALAFGDVGRLWNAGASPSLSGLHWAAGVGGRLQFGKANIFGLDIGVNDADGVAFGVGTSFAF